MTRLPGTKVVHLERRQSHLFATLDDAATRNALSDAMVTDLEAVLAATRDIATLRTLVIRGTQGRFCAGGNLKGMDANAAKVGDGTDPIREDSIRGGRLFHALNRHPMVVIALVNGPAMGGGFGLACCADIVITTPAARFALSETTLGLVPAQIAPMVIDRIGLRATRKLALTGGRLDGAQALAIGLSDHHCANAEEADALLDTLLQQIGRCGPRANAATKRLLLDIAGGDSEQQIARAADVFTECLNGAEGREGIAAFVGKRRPDWAEPE